MSGVYPVTEKEYEVMEDYDSLEEEIDSFIRNGYEEACKEHKKHNNKCWHCKTHKRYLETKRKFAYIQSDRINLFIKRCASFQKNEFS